jgi:hypothetical protein
MARTPAIFRQGDVTRLVKAATAAGVHIARIEVDSTGKIAIVTTEAQPAVQDDLDRELSAFQASHGQS